MALTDIQIKFAAEVVSAYKRGEKIDRAKIAVAAGYSEKSARQAASQNMNNDEVMTAILSQTSGAKPKTKQEKLNEEWVVSRMMKLAMDGKNESVRGKMLEVLGKHHTLGLWTERHEMVDVPAEREKLLERIKQRNAKLGIPTIGSPTGDVPGLGESAPVGTEEQTGQRGTNSDSEGFPIGQLGDKTVQRGERVGEDSDTGDGCGATDDRETPVAGDG